MLKFFELVGKLKDVERRGWYLRNIEKPESVADHSWRMAVMALVLAKKLNLDENKAVKIALVHDLAEAVVGDYVPGEISPIEKHNAERDAMRAICKELGSAGDELFLLWEEYDSRQTPEAKLVKEIDRLETVIQAGEYEMSGRHENLQEFIDAGEGFFKFEGMEQIFNELKGKRSKK